MSNINFHGVVSTFVLTAKKWFFPIKSPIITFLGQELRGTLKFISYKILNIRFVDKLSFSHRIRYKIHCTAFLKQELTLSLFSTLKMCAKNLYFSK